MKKYYTQFSDQQIDKIGNTIIYLSAKIEKLSKTKLLKFLYILDELSIKKSGLPFLNLKYKVWKFGPVAEDIFIELSTDIKLFDKYIKKINLDNNSYIIPNQEFSDNEFSDNDIELLDTVIEKFRHYNAEELIAYTHRPKSLWYETAKENSVLDLLENETINSTELVLDMSKLVENDEYKKSMYLDYIEQN